jgi:hypothetical protein
MEAMRDVRPAVYAGIPHKRVRKHGITETTGGNVFPEGWLAERSRGRKTLHDWPPCVQATDQQIATAPNTPGGPLFRLRTANETFCAARAPDRDLCGSAQT